MSYDAPSPEPIRPILTELNRPFWEGCAAGKLLVQKSIPSGLLRYPPAIVCPFTLEPDYEWVELGGRGKVHSYVVFDRVYHPSWEGKTPYIVALIELEEGPVMLSNVVGIDRADIRIGMPVGVEFEDLGEGIAKPVFRPVAD